jgi:integrase
VEKFRSERRRAGLAVGTLNDHLNILSICFGEAQRQGHITFNPARAVKPLPDTASTTRKAFTLPQVQAILAAATGDWAGAVRVAFYTGARLRDVANLKWSALDFENRWVTFKQIKTGKMVRLPMHDALYDCLGDQGPVGGDAFLFPTLAGRIAGGREGLSAQFMALMKRAGVDCKGIKNGKHSVSELSFHSFRHTINTTMTDAGTPIELRQKITGHASAEMNLHYSGEQIAGLRKAVDSLPRI